MLIDAIATAIGKVETRNLFHAKQYLDAAFNGGQKHIGVETRHGGKCGFRRTQDWLVLLRQGFSGTSWGLDDRAKQGDPNKVSAFGFDF
ncbi:MAG: hypothetical protein KDI60_07275 [Xanthomonadales bacterium]|nr:hypothetical protein [Xanthomonadales bacterium]MCB1611541.1 hypothetical protein [Xanthomonadales bacterium]